ncbi:MAG: ATP-binding cassette domain-containing protein [Desulfovibrionaceae bacterium]|nr:ATP-binding cassette domain-containing protein [Desulfovibrionaceae bacterium]
MRAEALKKAKTSSALALAARTKSWLELMLAIPAFVPDAATLAAVTVTVNVLALALPLALMQIYDRIIPNSSFSTLGWLIIGVATAIILETALKIVRGFISNWFSARLEHILKSEALDHFLSARLDGYEKDRPGVHFERFNSIGIIKAYLSGQVMNVLLDLPFAILYLGLLYYIGGGLCFFTLLCIAVFFAITLFYKARFTRQNTRQVALNNEKLDFLLESLGGIHTVKALNMEDRLARKFENIEGRAAENSLKANRWRSIPANSAQFISQLNTLGIIFLGADLVIKGSLTVGAMTACTMLATRGIQPIIKFAGFFLRFSEVGMAQKRIGRIIELGASPGEADIPLIKDVEGNVFFEEVSLLEADGNVVIPKFSAVFPAGDVVGVTGTNPRQTTALMLLLCGMYKPTGGTVHIDEYLISSMDHSRFNGRVMYLPKRGRLFQGSILDNIVMFDPAKKDRALNVASLLSMDTFVANLPNGYETQVDQRSNHSLPLGLIHRICVARALVTGPRVLILDRLLNSLDRDTLEITLEILGKMRGRCTIFLVADHGEFFMDIDSVVRCAADSLTVRPA